MSSRHDTKSRRHPHPVVGSPKSPKSSAVGQRTQPTRNAKKVIPADIDDISSDSSATSPVRKSSVMKPNRLCLPEPARVGQPQPSPRRHQRNVISDSDEEPRLEVVESFAGDAESDPNDTFNVVDQIHGSPGPAGPTHLRKYYRRGECSCAEEKRCPVPQIIEGTDTDGRPIITLFATGNVDSLPSMELATTVIDQCTTGSPAQLCPTRQQLEEKIYVDADGVSLLPEYTDRYGPVVRDTVVYRRLLKEMELLDLVEPTAEDLVDKPKATRVATIISEIATFHRRWCAESHKGERLVVSIRGVNFLPLVDGVVGLYPLSNANCLSPDYAWIAHRLVDLVPYHQSHQLFIRVDPDTLNDNICELHVLKPGEVDPTTPVPKPTVKRTAVARRQSTEPEGKDRHQWNVGDKIGIVSGGAHLLFRWDGVPDLVNPEVIMRGGGREILGERMMKYPDDFTLDPVAYKRLDFSSYRGHRWLHYGEYGMPAPDILANLTIAEEQELINRNAAAYASKEPVGLSKILTDKDGSEFDLRPYFEGGRDAVMYDRHQSIATSAYEHSPAVRTSLNHRANLHNLFRSVGGEGLRLGLSYYSNGSGRQIPCFTGSIFDVLMCQWSRTAGTVEKAAMRHHVRLMAVDGQPADGPVKLFGDYRDVLRQQQIFDTIRSPETAKAITRWNVDFPTIRTITGLKLLYGQRLRYVLSEEESAISGRGLVVTFGNELNDSINRIRDEPVGPVFVLEEPATAGEEAALQAVTPLVYYHYTTSMGEGSENGIVIASVVRDPCPAAMRDKTFNNLVGAAITAGVNDFMAGLVRVPVWTDRQSDDGMATASQQSVDSIATEPHWRNCTVVIGGQQAMRLAELLQVAPCGFNNMSYSDLLLWSDSREMILNGRDGRPAKWVLEAIGTGDAYPSPREIRRPLGVTDNDVELMIVSQSVLLPAIAMNIANRGHHFCHVDLPRKVSGIASDVYYRADIHSHALQTKTTEVSEAYGMMTAKLTQMVDNSTRDWRRRPAELAEVFGIDGLERQEVEGEITRVLQPATVKKRGSDGRKYRAAQLEPLLGERAAHPLAVLDLVEVRMSNKGFEAQTVGDWRLLESIEVNDVAYKSKIFLTEVHNAHWYNRASVIQIDGGESEEERAVGKRYHVDPQLAEASLTGYEVLRRAHVNVSSRIMPYGGNYGHKGSKGAASQVGKESLMAPAANPYPELSAKEPMSPEKWESRMATLKKKDGKKSEVKQEIRDLNAEKPTPVGPARPKPQKNSGINKPKETPQSAETKSKGAAKRKDRDESDTPSGPKKVRHDAAEEPTDKRADAVVSAQANRETFDLRADSRPSSRSDSGSKYKTIGEYRSRYPWSAQGAEASLKRIWKALGDMVVKEEAPPGMAQQVVTPTDLQVAGVIAKAWQSRYPSLDLADEEQVHTKPFKRLFLESAVCRRLELGIYSRANKAKLAKLIAKDDRHSTFYGCLNGKVELMRRDSNATEESASPRSAVKVPERNQPTTSAAAKSSSRHEPSESGRATDGGKGKRLPYASGMLIDTAVLSHYDPPQPPFRVSKVPRTGAEIIRQVSVIDGEGREFIATIRGRIYLHLCGLAHANKRSWVPTIEDVDDEIYQARKDLAARLESESKIRLA